MWNTPKNREWIQKLPKAELHLHIEGTLEPELLFKLAERNGVRLRFKSVDALRQAYNFQDLQSFLDIYYEGASALITAEDFFDLAWAYYQRAHQDGVRGAEIFFDPQTHTDRGIAFEVVLDGLLSAAKKAEQTFQMHCGLILCFLRHLPEESAMETLKRALPHKDKFLAVGLDSSERDFPPRLFSRVFQQAREAGLRTVAHAGEEGPSDYIWEALNLLHVARIDHGVRCTEDARLVEKLKADQVPLTVCPLSNLKLRVVRDLKQHNMGQLLRQGLCVTINSDDPAYFGGYVLENYVQTADALGLTPNELQKLARNSLEASFAPIDLKKTWISELEMVDLRLPKAGA